MKKNSEEYCQIFAVSFLNKLRMSGYDFIFWHTPNGGSRNKAEASKLKMMGVLPGVPDLIIMAREKVIFVEFKDATGKASNVQKDFRDKAREYGFAYEIVSMSDIKDAIKRISCVLIERLGFDHHGISKESSAFLSGAGVQSFL